MQLSDIVEKYSLKTMSERTNISENNLEYMIAEDFSRLTRPKALGFISILEREYDVDLKPLKKAAIAYYKSNQYDTQSVSIGLPIDEKKKGQSKWFFFFIFALLVYASWYFFSQFNQHTLGNMLSLNELNQSKDLNVSSDEQNTTNTQKESHENDGLSIKNVLKSIGIDSTDDEDVDINAKEITEENDVIVVGSSVQEPNAGENNVTVVESNTKASNEVNTVTSNNATVVQDATNTTIVTDKKVDTTVTPTPEVNDTSTPKTVSPKKPSKVMLKPKRRLWFGLVNMSNKKRDHFSISDQYAIDVSHNKRWLVATSAAAFSIKYNDETKMYNNGRAHYFKVTQEGITPLSKREYVNEGGWRKW